MRPFSGDCASGAPSFRASTEASILAGGVSWHEKPDEPNGGNLTNLTGVFSIDKPSYERLFFELLYVLIDQPRRTE